jgi:transcriptional regulator with XRE-family HTH domain
MNSSIATRLAAAIVASGESANRIGTIAGASPGYVRLLIRGARRQPSAEALGRVAAVLGVSIEWLVMGAGPPPTEEHIRASVARAAEAIGTARNALARGGV